MTLAELAMTGLKEASEKTLAGRALACPSCGAVLAVQLASTQSLSFHQCQAVVDIAQGVGADLAHKLLIIDKLTPHKLWSERVEKKNVALAIVVGAMCIAIGLIVAAAVHG